ncbi:MAG: response regulator transcription factor [Elusimicrobia bacterium]|nr:response regulator transcription factor [Elusimicrobiota bacterium]
MSRARILLVEDHPIVRQGITQLLDQEPDLAVCGFADDAGSALAAIRKQRPDMLILDISLKSADGIELLRDLRGRGIEVPVLVLSMHDESTYADQALRAGAQGYLMKGEPTEKLLAAVRGVLAGRVCVSEEVQGEIMMRHLGGVRDRVSSVSMLTDRELQIFRLIGEGRSTREISQLLRRSVKTVDAHRENIKLKLSVKNSTQLLLCAARWVSALPPRRTP